MIKCNVTVCGTICRSAEEKTSHDGNKFITFPIVLHLQGKDLTVNELYISVSAPGDQAIASEYSTGRKIKTSGHLYVRKHNGKVYYNLRTDTGIEYCESTEKDTITGNMEFRGKISKAGIKELKSKKGKDFQSFSAFSSDIEGEKREFTWVNFFNLTPVHADYFAGEKYVEIHGELQLDIYKNEMSLGCKVSSVSPWDIKKNDNSNAEQ